MSEDKQINVKEIENLLNDLFETNIQWSKLSIEELNQLIDLFTNNEKLMNFIKKLIKVIPSDKVSEIVREFPSDLLGEVCIDWVADKLAGAGKVIELVSAIVPEVKKVREATQQIANRIVVLAKILEKMKQKK